MTEEQTNLLHQPMTTISAQFNTNENPSSLLLRLESTSTMIKEEQQIYLDSTVRTLFKSTSRFNKGKNFIYIFHFSILSFFVFF